MQLVRFFKDMQLFNVTSHQNSKLDSSRLGLTLQIEFPLSCRRVWFVNYMQKQNFTRELLTNILS